MRRYLHPALPAPGERLLLDRATSHHLLEVCRHPRGEPLRLFDGRGQEARCRLVGVEGGQALVEGLEEVHTPPAGARRVLLLALCKGPAFETALRMASELGVGEIRPVLAARSNLRRGNAERWRRVLEAASRQCGRAELPALAELAPLGTAMAAPDLPTTRWVATLAADLKPPPTGDLALLVGPEGGLSATELAEAHTAGFEPVGLGPLVLRVDTAVAAALARALG
ncbi:MAG: RsmE family RNA methyltransferase [Pseudomonadota bacterium]